MKIYIIKTTFDNIKDANKLQSILLDKRLVSCVQLSQIKSAYIWNDKICNEDEIQLSIKTNKKNAKRNRFIKNYIYRRYGKNLSIVKTL